jgi:pantoate--beta-alanine ligase
VQPDRAYLGLKDYQQFVVIRQMAKDLNMRTAVVGCQTVREPGGLAMSSRNKYLSPEQRQHALALYRALTRARDLVAGGEASAPKLVGEMQAIIDSVPHGDIDYISIVDPDTLEDVETIDRRCVAALALRIGQARLIDNMFLDPPSR